GGAVAAVRGGPALGPARRHGTAGHARGLHGRLQAHPRQGLPHRPVPPGDPRQARPDRHAEFMAAFANLTQFAEVGQGNMNWPDLLPAAEKAGAEYFLIEQDDTYGRDPIDCIRESREYLRSIGY